MKKKILTTTLWKVNLPLMGIPSQKSSNVETFQCHDMMEDRTIRSSPALDIHLWKYLNSFRIVFYHWYVYTTMQNTSIDVVSLRNYY